MSLPPCDKPKNRNILEQIKGVAGIHSSFRFFVRKGLRTFRRALSCDLCKKISRNYPQKVLFLWAEMDFSIFLLYGLLQAMSLLVLFVTSQINEGISALWAGTALPVACADHMAVG